jgi:hypothetical protein
MGQQPTKEPLQIPVRLRLLDGVRRDSSHFYLLMIWNDATLAISLHNNMAAI